MKDYNKVLTQAQPYPSVVLAWICLPGLLGFMYKRQIIEAIGSLIGKVVKLDFQTNNSTWGRFSCLAVFVNLDRPLISKVLVDGEVQRVEYESLPTVCFNYGKYGHVKELCLSVGVDAVLERPEAVLERTEADAVVASDEVAGEDGDHMILEPALDSRSSGPMDSETRLENSKEGVQACGLSNALLGGPSEERAEQKGPLMSNGLILNGLDNITSNDAISSMVNLVNSQVGPGLDVIGGCVEGQIGDFRSSSA
ncbi:hypothetical protein GOBAR_AA20259 [Gossypium barbadense]|uniref:Uncharacterized protein n=1 Tax=Gossypium barbadense TaxID=3634 RepID=A0A2P5XAP0_GOSBA|nr:hypothetical protein GOBAR_AA20259 [Gossypium barbadense]